MLLNRGVGGDNSVQYIGRYATHAVSKAAPWQLKWRALQLIPSRGLQHCVCSFLCGVSVCGGGES